MFKGAISLTTALQITILSMIVVFFILLTVAFVLSLFKYIPSEKIVETKDIKRGPVQDTKQVIEKEKFDPSKITSEEMKVAMMIACIEAAGEDKNVNIKVVGIKELN